MSTDALDDVGDLAPEDVEVSTDHRVAFRPARELAVVDQHAEIDAAAWWRWSG